MEACGCLSIYLVLREMPISQGEGEGAGNGNLEVIFEVIFRQIMITDEGISLFF